MANRANLRLEFAKRTIDHAQFAYENGRLVESQIMIGKAIDWLDKALNIVWEEQNESNRNPEDRRKTPPPN